MPIGRAKAGGGLGEIEDIWRRLSASLIQSRHTVSDITRRIDERESDPNYTDRPFEVFCTVDEDGEGQSLVDYYF
jgi:hypothetical protein